MHFVTLAVATKFFERMTDGGVARTTPHCITPHAHGLWTFYQLLAVMDSDTAGCLSDNRAEPPAYYTESPQAQAQSHIRHRPMARKGATAS